MKMPTAEGYRLSPQQENAWLALRSGMPLLSRCLVQIEGPLKIRRLRAALRAVIRRHEILRTSIICFEGMATPLQTIHETLLEDFEIADLSRLEPTRQLREALRIFEALVPQEGYRYLLLQLSATYFLLLISAPAMLGDRAGLNNLVSDLVTEYRSGGKRGQQLRVMQYADAAQWLWEEGQQENPQPRDYQGETRFRSGVNPVRRRLGCVERQLDETIVRAVDASGLGMGALESFLLACWTSILFRYGTLAQPQIGLVCDGRHQSELRRLPGAFEHNHLTVLDVDQSAQFFSLWSQTQQAVLKPCISLEVCPASQTPLFKFCGERVQHTVEDVHFQVTREQGCTLPFRLFLACTRQAETVSLELQYDSSTYTEDVASGILRSLVTFAAAAAVEPTLPICELPLLSRDEQQLLVDHWTQTERDSGNISSCVHEHIDAQAKRTPDSVAAIYEGRHLTFEGLTQAAELWASALRKSGARPESVVAVCLERSLDLPVALLAVLKAGSAYLPLEPGYPLKRLAAMLRDSKAGIVLTVRHLSEKLREHADCLVEMDAPGAPETSRLLPQAQAKNAAYVIYTSGSSGIPKGIVVSHSAIVNRLLWMQRRFPLRPHNRVLQKTPFTFDASIWEIFLPLISGACCVLARNGSHADTAYLAATVIRDRITVLQLVPSVLRSFLEEPDARRCQSLQHLFAGGEVLPIEVERRCVNYLPANLVNLYGPTECTIDASYWCCTGTSEGPSTPIGQPIDNMRLYVLDKFLEPVPPGAVGDLYVSGSGLARGYVGKPGITAERFLPNPFDSAGTRMYHTGDRARFSFKGVVYFIGRSDQQFKLHGVRIEPGEIEAKLREHPSVLNAAVITQNQDDGPPRLVGYFVPRFDSGALPTETELKSFLRLCLPENMIPHSLSVIEAFPLNANGKLDRRALADMSSEPRTRQMPTPPRDSIEMTLVEIWEDVLKRRQIGIRDSFFEIGGHSLNAVQVMSRIQKTFQANLPLRAIFEYTTIEELASAVRSSVVTNCHADSPVVRQYDRTSHMPTSPAQERVWLLQQLEPESPYYNIPLAIRMTGPLNVRNFVKSINDVVQRHESLRTRFVALDGRPLQVIMAPGIFRMPLIDISSLPDELRMRTATRLREEEAHRPSRLDSNSLFRVVLLRLAPEIHDALLTVHHIVSDGWSTGVLIRDVGSLYRSYTERRPSDLRPLEIQYADYSLWQRELLAGQVLETGIQFWRAELDKLPPTLTIPADRSAPAVASYRGATIPFVLSSDAIAKLRGIGSGCGATLFMVLAASLGVLLARYSGQLDIPLGIPVANRNRREVEDLIGFFVNTIVLRIRLQPTMSFEELVRQVRQTCLRVYAYQHIPFEMVVERLQPDRSLNQNPLFQTMLALQNAPTDFPSFPNLVIETLPADTDTSKFLLTFLLTETGEEVRGTVEYATDLFDENTIRDLVECWQTLVDRIASTPGAPVLKVPLLVEKQQLSLVIAGSGPDRERAQLSESFATRFLHQAMITPDRIAIADSGMQITYGRLCEQAMAQAHCFRAGGLTKEMIMPVLGARGIDLIAAILATFFAGGVYLPLDPDQPNERIRGILERVGCRLIATTRAHADRTYQIVESLSACQRPTVCVLPADLELLGRADTLCEIHEKAAAYLIFTSGSTGIPKGVVIEHQGMLNHLLAKVDTLGLVPADVIAQTASQAFDISIWQMLAGLLVGARIQVISSDQVRDPGALREDIWRYGISVIEVVPALLRELLRRGVAGAGRDRAFTSARSVIVTGEELSEDLWREWFSVFPDLPLINAYGPTECSDDVSQWPSAPPVTGNRVRIGKPLSGVRLYILDQHDNLVPQGVAGELVVGGMAVGRGYFNDPIQTAAAFVPDRFVSTPGARAYKTGDLARWTVSGELEYLGRMDEQIKLRGFRIDLREIEAVLTAHPEVRECVILSHQERAEDTWISAHYVPVSAQGAAPRVLRNYLRSRLPDYMVPAMFIPLERLPLGPNGKLDRQALASIKRWQQESDERRLPAENNTEKRILEVWRGVLGTDEVGVEDDFFDVGGHSLMATQVAARVEQVFHVALPLRTYFERRTIRELATDIDAAVYSGECPVRQRIPRLPRLASPQATQ